MFDGKAKYIIVEYPMGADTPYVFPVWEKHSDVAERMRALPDRVLSAGFVSFSAECDTGNCPCAIVYVTAFGDSISLGKKSRPEDSKLIAKALGIHRD